MGNLNVSADQPVPINRVVRLGGNDVQGDRVFFSIREDGYERSKVDVVPMRTGEVMAQSKISDMPT
jgi:hypothetical protein